MTQQSLEELSSIYSEANELGLTALGVTQPQQGGEGDSGGIVQHLAAEGRLETGGGGYYSDQDILQHSTATESKREQQEAGDYYSDDQEALQNDDQDPATGMAAESQLQHELGYFSDQVR
jgi:hypothetical protein